MNRVFDIADHGLVRRRGRDDPSLSSFLSPITTENELRLQVEEYARVVTATYEPHAVQLNPPQESEVAHPDYENQMISTELVNPRVYKRCNFCRKLDKNTFTDKRNNHIYDCHDYYAEDDVLAKSIDLSPILRKHIYAVQSRIKRDRAVTNNRKMRKDAADAMATWYDHTFVPSPMLIGDTYGQDVRSEYHSVQRRILLQERSEDQVNDWEAAIGRANDAAFRYWYITFRSHAWYAEMLTRAGAAPIA